MGLTLFSPLPLHPFNVAQKSGVSPQEMTCSVVFSTLPRVARDVIAAMLVKHKRKVSH